MLLESGLQRLKVWKAKFVFSQRDLSFWEAERNEARQSTSRKRKVLSRKLKKELARLFSSENNDFQAEWNYFWCFLCPLTPKMTFNLKLFTLIFLFFRNNEITAWMPWKKEKIKKKNNTTKMVCNRKSAWKDTMHYEIWKGRNNQKIINKVRMA